MTEPRSATRTTAVAALAGVSAIAAVVSYLHALAVVRAVGATAPVSYLIPFLADLVILGASAAMIDAARGGAAKPRLATVSLVAGVGVTLAMNVAAGLGHGVAGALVAGWPAVAFVLSLESLAVLVRSGRTSGKFPEVPATADQCPHTVATTRDDAITAAYLHARDCLGEPLSYRSLAASFDMHHSAVGRLVKTHLNGDAPDEPDDH